VIRLLLLHLPEWVERLMLGASLYEVGPTGSRALSLDWVWKSNGIFVIVDTYIDESGTHKSSPHLIMGGMVGRLGQWAYFDKLWGKMLRKEQVAYYHTKSMKDSDGPFVGWSMERKAKLITKCGDIQQRATMFCFSIKLCKDEYLEHYKNGQQPKKVQLDTMYGMCFRYCAILVADLLKKTLDKPDLTINFILEEGAKNFGQAKKIFGELKAEDAFKNTFGAINPGEKIKFPGLQGADFVSHTTFLAEQDTPDLTDFPAGANVEDARKIIGHRSPAFRCHIGPEVLADWKQRMLDIDAERIAFGQRKKISPSAVAAE
jgi:hypothetical protein